MVNEDGVVRKWKENLPLSEVKKGAITSDTLKKLSPMKEPDDTTEEIAQQVSLLTSFVCSLCIPFILSDVNAFSAFEEPAR